MKNAHFQKRIISVNTKALIFILCLGLIAPAVVCAQNFSGQWLGKVTESLNDCDRIGKTEPGDYKLTIVHKNEDIMLMENVEQVPYRGVVRPDRPLKVFVQGVYDLHGGYVTEMLDIEFDDAQKGQGQSVWSWSDGYYQCGGRFKFGLEKIRD